MCIVLATCAVQLELLGPVTSASHPDQPWYAVMHDQSTRATLHATCLFWEASHDVTVLLMLADLHLLASAAGSPLPIEQPWSQLCSKVSQLLFHVKQ